MTMPSASIANELGRLLTEKKLYLTTAESCTGGQIASALCAAKDTPRSMAAVLLPSLMKQKSPPLA